MALFNNWLGDNLNLDSNYVIRAPRENLDSDVLKLFDTFRLADEERAYRLALKDFAKFSNLMEMVCVASIDAYESIINVDNEDGPKLFASFITTYKYLKRAVYRATPFGAFSVVSAAKLGSQHNTMIQQYCKHRYIRHIRISPQWLLGVYESIIIHLSKYPDQKFCLGSSIVECGDFWNFYVIGENPIYKSGDVIKYKKTEPLCNIVSLLKEKGPLSLVEIIESVINQGSFNSVSGIVNMLTNLARERFIVGEFYPNSQYDTQNFISYVEKIANVQKTLLTEKLFAIGRDIDDYLTNGTTKDYLLLVDKMKEVFDCTTPVIVDIEGSEDNGIFEFSVSKFDEFGKFIAETTELLNDGHEQRIETFERIFLSKFGTNRNVRLLEAMDENIGLNSPFNKQAEQTTVRKKNSEYLKIIEDEYRYSELMGEPLRLERVESLKPSLHARKTTISFDLNYVVHPLKDKCVFELDSVPASMHEHAYNGRFGYFLKKESDYPNNTDCLDTTSLRYFSENVDVQNINFNSDLLNETIVVNGYCGADGASFPLSEVYLCADNDGRVHVCGPSGRELRVVQQNMANTDLMDDTVGYLLWKFGNQNAISMFVAFLRKLGEAHRVRIMYKDIVICPEAWRLGKAVLANVRANPAKVRSTMVALGIPQKVRLVKNDQAIPIDFDNNNDIQIFVKELARSKELEVE